jgi:hypothetical protein
VRRDQGKESIFSKVASTFNIISLWLQNEYSAFAGKWYNSNQYYFVTAKPSLPKLQLHQTRTLPSLDVKKLRIHLTHPAIEQLLMLSFQAREA